MPHELNQFAVDNVSAAIQVDHRPEAQKLGQSNHAGDRCPIEAEFSHGRLSYHSLTQIISGAPMMRADPSSTATVKPHTQHRLNSDWPKARLNPSQETVIPSPFTNSKLAVQDRKSGWSVDRSRYARTGITAR